MFERFSEDARRAVFFSRYEASQYGSPHIEIGHFLLGLIREDKRLQTRYGLTRAGIEGKYKLQHGEKLGTSVDLPLSHQCKRVLNYALEISDRTKQGGRITCEHLYAGCLQGLGLWEECGTVLHFLAANLNLRQNLANSRKSWTRTRS